MLYPFSLTLDLYIQAESFEEAKKLAEAYVQDASLDTTDYPEIVQDVLEQHMDCCASEYKASLKSFEKLMDTEACEWSVGYSGYSFDFMFDDLLYHEDPYDCDKDICLSDLRGKLLFRYINNNIMPYITKGRYYSKGKYVDGKYQYKDRHSKILLENNNYPLTGVCYDQDILDPIIRYYKTWNSYPEDFSWPDLMRQCYDNFFKSWHEEYEYWADNEDAIREELT